MTELTTDFWKKHLDETLFAIGKLTANGNGGEISVKKVRQIHGVQPSNRSVINFYARALVYLKDTGILKLVVNNSRSPRKYAVKNREKLMSLIK